MNHVISISTIDTPNSGSLSFFEGMNDINFEIKRIFFIHGVPICTKRGGHAHKKVKQFLFCPHGSIKITADDGQNISEYILDSPSTGLLFEERIWLDLEWLVSESVLCVVASDYYDEDDYIRNYTEFKELVI